MLAILQPLPARPIEADALLGEWEQVATNAGSCPACRITFRAGEQGLTVVANNGWTAKLYGFGGRQCVGAGRWENARRTWIDGRPFTIAFRLEDDRLEMTMTVDTGTGRKPWVRGTFRRAWQGV